MKVRDLRLRKLEEMNQKTASPKIMLFWDEELLTCGSHPHCGIEHASGTHHSPLVRLNFGDGVHA